MSATCSAKTENEFRKLSTINGNGDRLLESKMWREPFAKRRCLMPASGLYEWLKENMAITQFYPEPSQELGPVDLFGTPEPTKRKAPKPKPVKRVFKITMADEGATPFAFAGIWDSWKRPDGTRLETFAIVATEPNELVSQIHSASSYLNAAGGYTIAGFTGTKTASSCVLTIAVGIITNVTGCQVTAS
jgi:putative SOS response-associated peptidase YedK